MRVIPGLIATLILATILYGCSGGGSAVIPSEDGNYNETPGLTDQINLQGEEHASNRYLWTMHLVYVDPAEHRWEVIPLRLAESHRNILSLLESAGPDCFHVVSIEPSGNDTLLVDIEIKHPFDPTFTGFDVRGIAMFNASKLFPVSGLTISDMNFGNGELVNAEGYTTLYNCTTAGHGLEGYYPGKISTTIPPNGALNGYMRFISDSPGNTRNAFLAGDSITRTFEIKMPGGPFVFGYAVDSSWAPPTKTPVENPIEDFPGNANCEEPWKIEVTEEPVGSGLTNIGGSTKLIIDVYDWQGKNSHFAPEIECPELFDDSKYAQWVENGTGYTRYSATISNESLVGTGVYEVLISVNDTADSTSPDWLDLTAYQIFPVEVKSGPFDGRWARTWGGTQHDRGRDVALDDSGNLYVTGDFQNTVDFNPGSGADYHASNGKSDVFLSKFDSSGNFIWTHTWGGAQYDEGNSVSIDSYSNVYVTGSYSDTVDFNPGPGTDFHTSHGGDDIFLCKFDSSGNYLLARTWGGTGYDDGYSVSVDSYGNAYVTGSYRDTVDFDPSSGIENHASKGQTDIFLCKYDSAGDFLWARTWGGTEYDYGYSVSVDSYSNAYVTGSYRDTVDFDPSSGIENHASKGQTDDIFLCKYDSVGDFLWARTWGGFMADSGSCVACDPTGNAYVGGHFRDYVDFNPDTGDNHHMSNGADDAFLSKFDGSGNYIWARTWGGNYADAGWEIAIDTNCNIYVTGSFKDSVDFDTSTGVDNHSSNGEADVFLSKLDSSGMFQCAQTWGGAYNDGGSGVMLDTSGNPYIVGYFRGTVDFDPGSGVDNQTSNGDNDIFLCKLIDDIQPPDPTITVISPNGGESWEFGSSHEITWSWTGEISNVKIEYSINGGSTWLSPPVCSSTECDGSFIWNPIPDTQSDNCRIRITDVSDSEVNDSSNSDFTIYEDSTPTITVTQPNGGESWEVGSSHAITWSWTGDIDSVKIMYSTNGGSTYPYTVTSSTSCDGSFIWNPIPNTPSDSCKIRITDVSDSDVNDSSNSDFTIYEDSSPTITVTQPNGGESWEVGSSHAITWSWTGDIDYVKIMYSTNGGSTYPYTVISSTSCDGIFIWSPIPDTPSTNCRVKITDVTDSEVNDSSNSNFTIYENSTPSITVNQPNGNESWKVGTNQAITWSWTGDIDYVKIVYSTNGGSTYPYTVTSSTPCDGNFIWYSIPDTPSTSCRVKITDVSDSDVYDTSNSNFTIYKYSPGSITVTQPNGGESWQVGSSQAITWSWTGDIDSVKIMYSTNGGSTYPYTVTSSTSCDGSFIWSPIPDTPSTNCRVKITDVSDSDVYDSSNSNFTIYENITSSITVTQPNGGESWEVGGSHAITWSWTGDIDYVKIMYSTNGGSTYPYTVTSSTSCDGSFIWNPIPNTPSTSCRVKITDVSNSSVYDESDGNFSIGSSGEIEETEPNDICPQATFLPAGTTGTGTLTYSSDTYDYWEFYLSEDSYVHMWLQITDGYDNHTSLELQTEDCDYISSDIIDNNGYYEVEGWLHTGTYKIELKQDYNSCSYRLWIDREPLDLDDDEPNNSIYDAINLPLETHVEGVLIYPCDEEDWWEFTIYNDSYIDILFHIIEGSDYLDWIRLRDSNGGFINGDMVNDNYSEIEAWLHPGTYYIQLKQHSNSCHYELFVDQNNLYLDETEPNDNNLDADNMSVGPHYRGLLIDPTDALDYWTFTLTSAESVSIIMQIMDMSDENCWLELYNADMDYIASTNSCVDHEYRIENEYLSAGKYYILLKQTFYSSYYELWVLD